MIYTNDETDKSSRQKNYYLTVYGFPILLVVVICGLVYWASQNNYLQKTDAIYGYIISLTPAVLLYTFNKQNWLKMPDGTFHYVKGLAPTHKINVNEPTEYEAEYYYSKMEKATTTFIGFALIGASVWLGIKGSKTILVPIMTNIGGLFVTYIGLKGLFDKSAKLKIAKSGLWTSKLGFVNWDDMHFAEVIEDKSEKQPKSYLHIRLKGTKFEEANIPDERLLLSDLKDNGMIETVINTSITNYNKQKKQSSS